MCDKKQQNGFYLVTSSRPFTYGQVVLMKYSQFWNVEPQSAQVGCTCMLSDEIVAVCVGLFLQLSEILHYGILRTIYTQSSTSQTSARDCLHMKIIFYS